MGLEEHECGEEAVGLHFAPADFILLSGDYSWLDSFLLIMTEDVIYDFLVWVCEA